MKIKVCGMREPDNVANVATLQPDYLGFIFAENSPRYVPEDMDIALADPDIPQRVGVFVNADFDTIQKKVRDYGLQVIQLHGDETPTLAKALRAHGLKVWKVFGVGKEGFDFSRLEPFLPVVDAFLFDTKGISRGGNGVAFDWGILEDYPYKKPFLLSGGVDLDNVNELPRLKDLPLLGIDVNSKFELEPAYKDVDMLAVLFEKVKGKNWRITEH
ncbi:MAG TPA: N-(5'-phosphoribosyl)anthranilate isomerase [Cytophagales bacterium]|nr:N-(5'-phosphoribosyl)anthranilate isomerase [Cytophagales bacterium]HAA18818.1 N-(5'-phosphoribosyl)anthranilate isomerase [Cytophagales bacterium]HAP64352.1 N-(5'-phosphoribosyl)anthranilate isomerase [Cytophagales bacterium]